MAEVKIKKRPIGPWKKTLILLAGISIAGGSLLAYHCYMNCGDYDQMLGRLLEGSVTYITPAGLAREIKSPNEPLLLDTRARAEFQVSHLPGARWLGYDEDFQQDLFEKLVRKTPKDKPIVVYCSVGYRSEKTGEKFQAAGFTNIRNLYGGIFQWFNEGRPVHQNGQAVERVHGYSENWGKWVTRPGVVYQAP